LLVAQTQKTQARKQWMADHLQLRGSVVVDAGAAKGARRGQKPVADRYGAVEGDFSRGDVIAVRDDRAAKSPAVWPTTPAPRRGCCAANRLRIEKLLGYMRRAEMLHRDNLVLSWRGK
jgi:glutamate 5-kinase